MAWARAVTDVPTILPIVLFEDGDCSILRPGDDGYEQALEDRHGVVGSGLAGAGRRRPRGCGARGPGAS